MQPFSEGFTAPTWDHVLVLIVGSILTQAAALLPLLCAWWGSNRPRTSPTITACSTAIAGQVAVARCLFRVIGWKNCVAEVRQALDAWRTIDGFAAGSQAGKRRTSDNDYTMQPMRFTAIAACRCTVTSTTTDWSPRRRGSRVVNALRAAVGSEPVRARLCGLTQTLWDFPGQLEQLTPIENRGWARSQITRMSPRAGRAVAEPTAKA